MIGLGRRIDAEVPGSLCARVRPHGGGNQPDVIDMRNDFCIPPDNERLRIVCADGAAYVRKPPHAYDLILVDGFSGEGIPDALCSPSFTGTAEPPSPREVCWWPMCRPIRNKPGTSLAELGRPSGLRHSVESDEGGNEIVTAGDPPCLKTHHATLAPAGGAGAGSPTNLGRVLYPIRTCIEAAPDTGFPARFRLTSRRTVSACATAHREIVVQPLFRRLLGCMALSPFAHVGQRQTPPPTRAAWLMDHDRDVSWCGAVVDDDGQPFG